MNKIIIYFLKCSICFTFILKILINISVELSGLWLIWFIIKGREKTVFCNKRISIYNIMSKVLLESAGIWVYKVSSGV